MEEGGGVPVGEATRLAATLEHVGRLFLTRGVVPLYVVLELRHLGLRSHSSCHSSYVVGDAPSVGCLCPLLGLLARWWYRDHKLLLRQVYEWAREERLEAVLVLVTERVPLMTLHPLP